MKIFNVDNLRNNQRFPIAVIAGLIGSILGALLVALVREIFKMDFSLTYIAAAYIIGMAIKTFGKGVDIKFSVLAVICFILSVFLADIISFTLNLGFFMPSALGHILMTTLESFTIIEASSIIRFVIIGYSAYIAYYVAKIV